MTTHAFLITLVAGVLCCWDAPGMFMVYETRTVPLDRLLGNLQQRQAQDTNDFEVTYQLARLHAMAYSTNLGEVKVRKDNVLQPVFAYPGLDSGVPQKVSLPSTSAGRQAAVAHLTNAILLYERAILLLKRSTNVSQRQWLILPTQLGFAWCLDQAGRRDEALREYRKALRLAWAIEVSGDFQIDKWVRDAWEDVRARRNPLRSHNRGHVGPGVCFSEEIIGYLLKLLDPVKDASEIAQLKKDQQTLQTMPRAITPIVIPLEPGAALADLVDADAQVTFDLDGSGKAKPWGWITSKAGWLVYDSDGRGNVTSGLQMFGNVTFWIFWRDGYQALRALDDNRDGVLSGAELKGLAVWRDLNGDGVSDPGEVLPGEALGIAGLDCSSEQTRSGIRWSPAGVRFTDGTVRPTYDWIAPSPPGK